jgi:hypothetical protein
MLAVTILTIILAGFSYSLFIKKSSYILSFFLVYTPLLPTLLKQIGIEGGSLLTRYLFLILILVIIKRNWNFSITLIKTNTIIYALILLIITMIVFNFLSANKLDPIVLEFQFYSFVYCFIPFFLIIFLLNSPKFLIDFVNSIPYWGILFISVFILFFDFQSIDYGDRFTFVKVTGFDTIASSRIFAISFIASLMLIIKKKKLNIYLLISAILSLLFLLIAGQRGTLIGVVLGFSIFGYFNLSKKNLPTMFISISTLFLLFYFRIIDLSSFQVFERLYELENYKEFDRFQDYFTTWEIFKNNSFWAGEGSYGYYFLTERDYPHNILLESASDYGLLGLISMIIIISKGLYYSLFLLRGKHIVYEFKIISIIWIMLLTSVLVSGNFVSNGIFFIFSGILVMARSLVGVYSTLLSTCLQKTERTAVSLLNTTT